MKTKMSHKYATPAAAKFITDFDLIGWRGQKGDIIRIATRGDPAAHRVIVSITDLFGDTLEHGSATHQELDKTWSYITTVAPPKSEVLVVFATIASSDDCDLAVMAAWVPYDV